MNIQHINWKILLHLSTEKYFFCGRQRFSYNFFKKNLDLDTLRSRVLSGEFATCDCDRV